VAKSIEGTFVVGDQPFPFTASLNGDRLSLESGGTKYELTRKPVPNPLGSGGTPTQAPTTQDPTTGQPGSVASLADLGPVITDPDREWTILVYLDGDNNLEPFALSDLNELEAGLPKSGIEVIVLCDRAEGYSDADGDWTDARLHRIRSDDDGTRVTSPVIAQPGEVNMGDPATLEAFVSGSLRAFPAPRTALIMWDHGGGWSVLASDDAAPGAEGGHDALTIQECAGAIRRGLAAAGVERLDIIGFDMCLMAQLETAVEVSDLAKVLVASQAIEPGDGWPYVEVLAQFARGTLGTTRTASEIVNAYAEFYSKRGDLLSTQSALDLGQTDTVLSSFDALLGAIDVTAAETWPALSRALFFAESYADMSDIRNGANALASVDLLDAMKRIRNNTPNFAAEKEFRAFIEAMDRFVLSSRTSPLRSRSNGVAAYAPVRGSLFNADYASTRFAERSQWNEWLTRLHTAQSAGSTAPEIGNFRLLENDTQAATASVTPLGGISVHFDLTGDNVLWTQALSGIWDDEQGGALVFNKWLVVDPEFFIKVLKGEKELGSDQLQLITPTYVNGRNALSQELTGVRFAIGNGEDAFYGTIDRSDINDRVNLRVPILFDHPSVGRYGGTLLFDSRTWEVVALVLEIVQPDGSMTFQQLAEVPPDAQITTLFEFVKLDGSIEFIQGGTMAWREGLELIMGKDDPGQYVVAFSAETVAGDSTTEFFRYEVTQPADEAAALAEGAKFTAEQLIGTWEWVGTPRGKTKPERIGLTTTIRRHPENPELLVGETTSATDANLREVALIIPDTRMLANIRFLGITDTGDVGGCQTYSALYALTNGVALLTLKDLATGRLFGMVNRGASGEVAQPEPEAVDPLVGVWQDAEGLLFGFDGQNWEMGFAGQVLDAGTYVKNGETVTVTSGVTGDVVRYTIKIRGKRMTATDEFGESNRLTKIQ